MHCLESRLSVMKVIPFDGKCSMHIKIVNADPERSDTWEKRAPKMSLFGQKRHLFIQATSEKVNLFYVI